MANLLLSSGFLQYNLSSPAEMRKCGSETLVDTNLIPLRLISDPPDAISQRETCLSNIQSICWPGPPPLGQRAWWALNQRSQLGNLAASHIQTVRLEEVNTLCSPVMARILVSAKFSLPWAVPNKHGKVLPLSKVIIFFGLQTTQGRLILFYLHYL